MSSNEKTTLATKEAPAEEATPVLEELQQSSSVESETQEEIDQPVASPELQTPEEETNQHKSIFLIGI